VFVASHNSSQILCVWARNIPLRTLHDACGSYLLQYSCPGVTQTRDLASGHTKPALAVSQLLAEHKLITSNTTSLCSHADILRSALHHLWWLVAG